MVQSQLMMFECTLKKQDHRKKCENIQLCPRWMNCTYKKCQLRGSHVPVSVGLSLRGLSLCDAFSGVSEEMRGRTVCYKSCLLFVHIAYALNKPEPLGKAKSREKGNRHNQLDSPPKKSNGTTAPYSIPKFHHHQWHLLL